MEGELKSVLKRRSPESGCGREREHWNGLDSTEGVLQLRSEG